MVVVTNSGVREEPYSFQLLTLGSGKIEIGAAMYDKGDGQGEFPALVILKAEVPGVVGTTVPTQAEVGTPLGPPEYQRMLLGMVFENEASVEVVLQYLNEIKGLFQEQAQATTTSQQAGI